ncbi:hypothetical protein SAMN05421741_12526 [Paenimyroides ummariense]|uniref:Curlin associated repeat-containing protein n=1 Tax=Paenimyroides ummariense TaxID=913024 RepID=A0A1I5F775_9FLAO|nr:hypothetical protein [Paenimyroides ummariense]SFO19607.1 hypothetical protein SAMN05421741_12526 [Paenimyroides ummariense]
MKNILSIILALFGTLTASAQLANNSLANNKELQKVHPETLMLNALNSTQGTYIVQTGNYNDVTIEAQQMQVNQTGDHQLLYYTETSKLEPSNMNINMEGANNYIEIYGNNSIMENMSINVQGNDRSVIIRNY